LEEAAIEDVPGGDRRRNRPGGRRVAGASCEIIVDGFRAKNGSLTANAKDITLPDGKKLFMGSSGTGAPYEPKK
jgi:hypothetical protein